METDQRGPERDGDSQVMDKCVCRTFFDFQVFWQVIAKRKEGMMAQGRPRGLYFEELSVGQEVESPARTVTEADVVQFAGLSGDYNQLHTDAEYAKSTPYGQRIAHGLLGLAIASGLAARAGFLEGTAQAFAGLTCKFKAPIFFGDSVRFRARVAKTRAMPRAGGGMVVFAVSLLNQHDKKVLEGEWNILVKGCPRQ